MHSIAAAPTMEIGANGGGNTTTMHPLKVFFFFLPTASVTPPYPATFTHSPTNTITSNTQSTGNYSPIAPLSPTNEVVSCELGLVLTAEKKKQKP